jgi:hypothetical protein
MRPLLPDHHPWKNKFFSLSMWEKGRTAYTKSFDFIFWFIWLMAIMILSAILTP